jgi:hypothetical protein
MRRTFGECSCVAGLAARGLESIAPRSVLGRGATRVAGRSVIPNLSAHHHGLLMEVEQQQIERRSARPGPCLQMQDRTGEKERPNATAFQGTVPGCFAGSKRQGPLLSMGPKFP